MKAPHFQHIIWDWNGTLMNDAWLCVEVLNSLLERRKLPLTTVEDYRVMFDFPVIRYYEKLGFDFVRDPFEKISHEYINEYNRRRMECALHVGTQESLTLLRDRGVSHSILSAYQRDTLHEIIGKYRLDHHFIGLNGLEDIYARSKVELGLRWVKQLPYDRSRILMVGDTAHDFEVADALGVSCVLLEHGHHAPVRLRSLTDRVLPDLQSLMSFLETGTFTRDKSTQ